MLNRILEGLRWRYNLASREASRKRYLRRTFSNGDALVASYTAKVPCDEAIGRDGLIVRHPPGRTSLAPMLIEVWFDEVYTRDFYQPSAGDAVIDAGANIGLFSLWVARACASCKVLAFEPFAENYNTLAANLAAARAANVKALLGAVSGTAGTADIIDGGPRSQDHRITAADASAPSRVPTYGLAEILELAAAPSIALFKCDIEGSEHDLFQHAAAEDLGRVRRFAIEYHDNIRPGTLQLLQSRLSKTHSVLVRPDGQWGYGMLYATRNDS